MRYSLVKLLLFLAGVAATVRAQPLTNVVIQPPCSINFQITTSGATSAVLNNLTGACTNWTISYSNTGFSAISLLVQDAPDSSGSPGTWVTFGGTVVSGSNPNTTTTSATTVLAGYYPWMRVILTSATGSGKVSGTLYGYLNTASTSSGSPPTGPAGGDLAGTYPNPTVVGINGTNLAGLGTGILKLATGTPSLAASADVIALWTGTCNSSSFLNGAGACTAPSSTPAFSSITSGTNTTAAMLVGVGASLNYNYTGAAAPTLPANTNMYLIGALASSSRVANVAFGGTAFHTDVRFDGTPDSSTAVASGEQIGGYNAFGYDGTALGGPLASVRIFANQNFAVGAHGTYVDITTTPNGSTTAAAVIRFENDAGITVPSTVTGGDKGAGTINATGLYVNGTAVSTTVGTVTSVATNNGLTGGTITTTGTLGFAAIANNAMLCNNSGGSAVPTTANCTVTGTGNAVMATSPTFVTPTLGAATATSINGLTITSSTGTLTITNAKTASFSNSITFAGTDSTTMTFPSSSASIPGLGIANSWSAAQTNTITGLGTTSTASWIHQNTTAATVGAQQYSPFTQWTGQGWKTTSTAGSEAVDMRAYVVPLQSTTTPLIYFPFDYRLNGGTWTNLITLGINGNGSTTNPIIYFGGTSGPGILASGQLMEVYSSSVVGATLSSLGITSGAGSGTNATLPVSAASYKVGGTKFTASGCSNSTTVGGATSGSYASGTTGSCAVTITFGNSQTGTNSSACWANDTTTPADTQSAVGSSTGVTITGTTISGDVIQWGCLLY